MKNPVTLYRFENDLNAYHLKNSIERSSNISVDINHDLSSHNYDILVDKSNLTKANMLLARELAYLNVLNDTMNNNGTEEVNEERKTSTIKETLITLENYCFSAFTTNRLIYGSLLFLVLS